MSKKKKKLNRNKDVCLNPTKIKYYSWHDAREEGIKWAKQTGIGLRVFHKFYHIISCGRHYHITKRN
tara:strand:+ start:1023 stop:1223 length:201 start_codon:yes stop_codon:yes gene_type:complete